MRDANQTNGAAPIPPAALPSPRALRRATLIALAAATAIFVVAVLPAEYDIDPTGIGELLGLKEIGEVKREGIEEAAEAARNAAATASSGTRVDTVVVPLHPSEGKEIKLVMRKGAAVRYVWSAAGGTVNYEAHGDTVGAPAGGFHSYKKGRGATADSGAFVAVFDGQHGWFWRNRTSGVVTITLRTDGDYQELKRLGGS